MKHYVTFSALLICLLKTASLFAQTTFTACSTCLSALPGPVTQSAFGDYDGDGDLDLLAGGLGNYTGGGSNGSQVSFTNLYTNNGSGAFNQNTAVTITGMSGGEIAWADYDRDGNLDFAIMGVYNYFASMTNTATPYLQIYRNTGNRSFAAPITLTGIEYGGLDWADYDNDGDVDLLATGVTGNSTSSQMQTLLYRNDGNSRFTSITTNLPALCWGNVKWGDYDNDGDPDVLICGQNTQAGYGIKGNNGVTRIYRNNGAGTFTDIQANLPGVAAGYAAWKDFDNDGYLDFALQGYSTSGPLLKFYRNQQNGTFTDLNLTLAGNYLGNLVWTDLNGDGNADLISGGQSGTKVYVQSGTNQFGVNQSLSGAFIAAGDCSGDRKPDLIGSSGAYPLYLNQSTAASPLPAVPADITAHKFGSDVLLIWNAVTGTQSMPKGFTYNVRVGTSSQGINTVSPASVLNSGFRQTVPDGNAGHANRMLLKNLPSGAYYWAVHAQNPAGQASAFSSEGSFTMPGMASVAYIDNQGNDTLCAGAGATLEAYVYPAATAYQWYRNNSPISNARSREYTATQSGTYKVNVTTSGGSLYSGGKNIYAYPAIVAPQVVNGSGCAGQSVLMSATPGSGATACTWYDANNRYLSTGTTYTVDSLPAGNTLYKVYSYNPATGCSSQSYATAYAIVNSIPDAPATQGQSACQPQAFQLSASPGSGGNTCRWYDHTHSDSILAQGNSFNTGVLQGTKTWHVGTYNTSSGCESATRTAATAAINPVTAAPITTDAVLCVPGSATLTATPGENATTCYWYADMEDTTPAYTGTSVSLPSVTADQTFFVSSADPAGHCESTVRSPATVTVSPTIAPPNTWDQQRYGTSAVTLEAWPGSGATTCHWYSSADKTTLLGTGRTYTTPALTASQTYYVSSYDEAHGCEGSDAVAIQAEILPPPTLLIHPDQVYPIPNLYCGDSYKNVNLFTGDVNLNFSLTEIQGPLLKYSLNAFYNSRGAGVTPLYTQNPLGGLGWKLMDYPKVVQDASTTTYYLLDGLQAYPLTQLSQTDTAIRFVASGNYHLWNITMGNLQQPTGSRTWKLVTDNGTQYGFTTPAIGQLDNNKPGYRWDLHSIREAQGRDSIIFTYNNGNLQQIQTVDLNTWNLSYDSLGRITQIEKVTKAVSAGVQYPQTLLQLTYGATFPGIANTQLSAVAYQQNVAPPPYTQAQYQTAAPPILFRYNQSNFPGALESMQVAQGGALEYEYTALPWLGRQYQPVTAVNTFSGTTFSLNSQTRQQYSPVTLRYTGPRITGDKQYLHFNQAEVIPGGNQMYQSIGDQSTSFETGTRDPVFRDLDPKYISSDYALSGSKSYFFDGVVSDNTIHSKVFTLNRKTFDVYENSSSGTPVTMKGAEDSVRVAFYLFCTHTTLNVEFLWTITFYDSRNRAINNGSAGGSREIDDDNYGNWLPIEIVQAVPANAVSFDFKIVGGRSLDHYDFYMDDLSVSGSHNTLNGKVIHHYFNGSDLANLAHVPGDYYTPYPDQQVRSIYKTGFEPGENYADWLNLDHTNSCKPQPQISDATRRVAFNGSAALGLSACDEQYSRVFPTSEINIPSGTDRVLLAFTYSSAQFSGMSFAIAGNVGRTAWDTAITINGSYYTDQRYIRFYKWFNVTNTSDDFGFVIQVLNAGGGKNLNEFFIDDLRIVFLDKDLAPDLPATQVTSSLYLALPYHSATLTQDNQEIESTEYFWIAGADAKAGNVPLPFLYRDFNVQQGVVGDYKTYTHTPDGRLVSEHTTRDLEMPDGTYQQVWYLDTYIYADSLYPALGRSGLNLLDEIVASVGSYSINSGTSWSLYSASLEAWDTITPPAPAEGSALPRIWVNRATYLPRSQLSLNSVYSTVRQLGSRAPDPLHWAITNEVLSVNSDGQPDQNRAADSLISWQLHSAMEVEDLWHKTWNRQPVTVAQFGDASPKNSMYYGFENYEAVPPASHYTPSNTYSFTGEQSGQGTFYFTMPFSQGETPGSSYLVAFQYLATSGSVKLTVSGNTGTIYSHTYTPVSTSSKYWQSVQYILTVPAGLTQLKIQLEGVNTSNPYFDDVRLLPAPASFSASIYTIEDYNVRAMLDNNGAEMRFLYNWKGEQYGTVGPGKVPQMFQTKYLSRMSPSGQGQYNPLIPNNSFTITPRDGGHYFAFNDEGDRSGWTISSASYAQFSQNGLSMNNTNTARIPSVWNPADWSNFGVSWQMLPVFSGSASTLESGFTVGNYKFTTRIARSSNQDQVTLSLYSGSSQTVIGTITYATQLYNPVYQVMVIFQGNHVHVWFNDQYISNTFNYTASGSSTLSLFYTRVSGTSSITFSDLSVFSAPEIKAVFSDGLENAIQRQEVSGNDLIVQETQYDLLFRPVLQTKKVQLSNQWPGFQPGFITSFDWETGEMLGSVQQAKNYVSDGDTDQKYMYWRCVWNESPELQMKMLFNPGADFALRKQSDIEKAERWAYTHEEQIFKAVKYSLDIAQIIIDPASAPVVITMDLLGLVRKHFTHSTDNVQQEQAITNKFYDPLQQQIQIKLPLANTTRHSKPKHILTYDYDFNGDMTVRTAPESDTSRFVYDALGRLRFSCDAHQAAHNLVAYFKYDRWNRALEMGVFSGSWDQATLQAHAADPHYPSSGTTVQTKYYYDGAEGSQHYLPPCRGHLTRTESYQNNSVSNSLTVSYDLNGNVAQTSQMISGSISPGTYLTQYHYDAVGNIKMIQYPNWNNKRFQVRYTYDYLGNMTNVGDSTAANCYASYEWNPDGSLYHEKLTQTNRVVLPVWHWYNAPGWNNYSGFGDTVRMPGVKHTWWGGFWPKINYSFSLYSEELDYNFLTDWWSDLWGQTYYNGDLTSSSYEPGLGNPAKELQQGYLYNDYGDLESYYNSYQNDQFFEHGLANRNLRDTLFFDLNGNLAMRNFGSDVAMLHAGIRYQYKISDSHNRASNMYYTEYSNESLIQHYLYDTLNIDYNSNGNVRTQHWIHRNATTTQGRPGSIAFQYWKRFNWDNFGKPGSITYRDTNSDSVAVAYTYDGSGMRLQKQVKGYHGTSLRQTRNTTYFRNGSGDPMMEIITGGSRDTVKYYVWGPTGIMVLFMNDGSSTKSWFVLKDGQGSAKQLVDRADRSVDEYYATDEYGLPISDQMHYTGLYNYIYTGQEYDRETGLHYFRARMYDPFSKLFLSPDPAGSNPATPYAFVNNDPVNTTDPSGAVPFEEVFDATAKEIAEAEVEFAGTSTESLVKKQLSVDTRTRKGMIEFRRRFNNPAAYDEQFGKIYRSGQKNGVNSKSIGNLLRPGGNHEMLPVSTWRALQGMGVKLEDIQRFSRETEETFFQILDPVNTKKGPGAGAQQWLPNAVAHGSSLPKSTYTGVKRKFTEFDYNRKSIGSGKVHNELIDVVWDVYAANGDKNELLNQVAAWMGGTRGKQLTRVFEDDLGDWMALLNSIR